MADSKISLLDTLAKGSVDPDADFLAIVDTDLTTTKKATPEAVVSDALLDLHVDTTDPANSALIKWPTADATRGSLILNAYEGNPGNPDASKNPVLAVTYNVGASGTIENATDGTGGGYWIEGNWHDGSNYVMEGYMQFTNGTAISRPYFCKYDKATARITNIDLIGGQTNGIYFRADDGAAGGDLIAQFKKNIYEFFAPASSANYIRIASASGQNSLWSMSANGDSNSTKPTFEMQAGFAGGTSEHRTLTMAMSDKTAKKTGVFSLRGDNTAGVNSVMVGIGGSTTQNTSMFKLDSSNMPTTYPTMQIVPVASQTRGLIECDTINNGTGAVEARGWELHPKGYIQVRESGYTGTHRTPGTGSASITPAWTNKPGASTSGTATWFPMLSTTGALFWVPGFAD